MQKIISEIERLYDLSHELYEKCNKERHALHVVEYDLEFTSLGEMEGFIELIASFVYSICYNRAVSLKHIGLLRQASIETSIPNNHMIRNYPLIFEYLIHWDRLRELTLKFIDEQVRELDELPAHLKINK